MVGVMMAVVMPAVVAVVVVEVVEVAMRTVLPGMFVISWE